MTVAELIETLKKMPADADIFVWESYNAGVMATDFAVYMEDGKVIMDK
jgi:hypothetical protein